MSNQLQKLAASFIGAARRDPGNKAKILRRAAHTFAELASDPRNIQAKPKLTSIGLNFAGAAMQAQQSAATTNDFHQLLKDTAEAWEQLGPDASFSTTTAQDATALTRGIAQANDPGNAQLISIAPASWNMDATLGRSSAVKFAPTADELRSGIAQEQTVAFWQGQKREAQAMTVDIGTPTLPVPMSGHSGPGVETRADARPFGILQYGSDGNLQNSVTVDVGTGRRFTVVGNYISVIVGMDPPGFNSSGLQFPAALMTLGASIGAFAAPSQAPVMRTVFFDNIDSTPQDPVNIPGRATMMFPPVYVNGFVGTIIVNFFGFGGQQITALVFSYSPTSLPADPIPVPPDAFAFRITASNGGNVRVPFQLSL